MTTKQQVLEIIHDEIESVKNNFPFTHDDEVKVDKLTDIYSLIDTTIIEQNNNCVKIANIDSYGLETPEAENDKRLFLIWLRDGLCPVCETDFITKIEDEQYIHDFNQGRHIFVCNKCGVVAKKDVKYRFV